MEELLVAVAAGDDRAFELVYERLVDRVGSVVIAVLRDHAQAEEVTQEVFLQLWRTAPRYSSVRGSVLTWALMLAHRRAVDRVRSCEASRCRDRALVMEWDCPFDEVTDTFSRGEEHRQVRRCLTELTHLQRESIMLAYYHGLTHEEIASILRVPANTIKTRLRDGLIHLRAAFQLLA